MGGWLGCEEKGKREKQKTCFLAGQVIYIHYFKDIHQGVLLVCVSRAGTATNNDKITDMSIHFFKIFCVYLLANNLSSNKVFFCQAKPHLFQYEFNFLLFFH